jgi:gas vesicle protein
MRGFSKTEAAGFFLTGAAIGAAAALLFAPKTGSQMRKDIRRFSKKTIDQLDDLKSDFRDQLRDQINEGYTQVKRMITTA